MQKIYIHIGTFKTGSTTLQFHMHKNRERLLENGYYYGDYFDHYYLHSNLCYGLLKEALAAYGCFEQYSSHPRFLNVAENPAEVIGRIKQNSSGCDNIIISSEAFFADAFRTLAGLWTPVTAQEKKDINMYMRKRLKELLSEISKDFVIVCYLRRQDLFIEAQYNQYLKTTWYKDTDKKLPEFAEFVKLCPIELRYFAVLEEWRDVFKDAVFLVKPYEKNAFEKDFVTDYYTDVLKINIDEVNKFENIERKQSNLRLDRNVLEYKKILDMRNAEINELFIEYSEQLGCIQDYAYFSKADRMKFMEPYREENENVAKKYLNRKDGILFEDTNYDIAEYGGLDNHMIFEITKWLLYKLKR